MTGYYASILQGALLTVGVSLAALGVAILLGLAGATAKLSGRPVLVGLAWGISAWAARKQARADARGLSPAD